MEILVSQIFWSNIIWCFPSRKKIPTLCQRINSPLTKTKTAKIATNFPKISITKLLLSAQITSHKTTKSSETIRPIERTFRTSNCRSWNFQHCAPTAPLNRRRPVRRRNVATLLNRRRRLQGMPDLRWLRRAGPSAKWRNSSRGSLRRRRPNLWAL